MLTSLGAVWQPFSPVLYTFPITSLQAQTLAWPKAYPIQHEHCWKGIEQVVPWVTLEAALPTVVQSHAEERNLVRALCPKA